jgi:pSer/pThr/pTyr-binding forkhead associated (FHA) protein
MTNKLEQLETRIRELVEVRIPGLLPGRAINDEVIRQLAGTMSANTAEENGRKIAPNLFSLVTHPDDVLIWQDALLLDAFKETIQAAGKETGLEFRVPPTLVVAGDSNLQPGEVRVESAHKVETVEPTNSIPAGEPVAPEENLIPANAYVILDGRKVVPLHEIVINIGRRLGNQISIDDPRVSRTHAQLRAIKERYVIFDLNSTGGTFVNGQRMNQSVLYSGDVISLAGVTLVYGQDNPPPRPDLKDTSPLSLQSRERTTVVLKERTDIRKKKK